MTFQVILYIKNPQKKGEKLYGDKNGTGRQQKNLLVGTYLNTLCISLKEKELLDGNGKMGKVLFVTDLHFCV